MRVLVTGGTGYVGRFIVEALLQQKIDVIVGGRRAPAAGLFSAAVPFRPLDLDPASDHASLLAGIDRLVHGAFDHVPGRYRGGEGDDPERFARLNRDGSIALFEAAKAAGVKRAVLLSTRAVYGPQGRQTILTERTPLKPDTLYGQVKRDAEMALNALASPDFVTASLRITGVYGAHRPGAAHKWQGLFSNFAAGRTITPRIATEVHGADVAQAVLLLLTHRHADAIAGRAFNVSDILLDQRDLLSRVKALTGIERPLPEAAGETSVDVMDCSALEGLGWRKGGFERLETALPDLVQPR